MINPPTPNCPGSHRLSRRTVLGGLGLGVAALATAAPAQAQLNQGYEAMLMKCIDPRFTTNSWNYMTGRGWQNNYSEFAFAGGPVGVVAPAFANWQETFWDNLAISVDLHWVKRIIGMTHRDCAAAAVAYGDLRQDRPRLRNRRCSPKPCGRFATKSSNASQNSLSNWASWTSTDSSNRSTDALLEQVGTAVASALQPLIASPRRDLGVVAGQQHLRHVESPPTGRPGVARPFQKPLFRECESSWCEAGFPSTSGSKRTTASIMTSAADSPPGST